MYIIANIMCVCIHTYYAAANTSTSSTVDALKTELASLQKSSDERFKSNDEAMKEKHEEIYTRIDLTFDGVMGTIDQEVKVQITGAYSQATLCTLKSFCKSITEGMTEGETEEKRQRMWERQRQHK
jgi:hypothetical protein